MPYEPISQRVAKEIRHEKAATWFVSDETGFSIILKATGTLIRAIVKGCPIEFVFGKDQQREKPILHIGTRIYDDPVNYANLSSCQRFMDEHTSIIRIIKNEVIPIQLYDETCVCVATGTVFIPTPDRKKILDFVGDIHSLYSGDFNATLQRSLDCFEYTNHPILNRKGAYIIDTLVVPCELSRLTVIPNSFFGVDDQNRVLISDQNEGETLEKQVYAVMKSLFQQDVCFRPQIPYKKGTRELTDILAFSDYGIFIVETKCLVVLNAEKERSMDRKIAGLQKQIAKAIDQVRGAAKKIQEKELIYSLNGELVEFNKTLLPHCIILVSELFPFGDWMPTVMQMFDAALAQSMQIHVIDLPEFMRYVGFSLGSKDRFDYLFVKRFEKLVETQVLHLQIQPANSIL